MANKKPLYIENGRIQEFGSGDTISPTIAPGSGGGGGGGMGWQAPSSGGISTSAFASKGCYFTPLVGFEMGYAWVRFNPAAGSVYSIRLWEMSGLTLSFPLTPSIPVPWTTTGDQAAIIDMGGVAVSAGSPCLLLVTRTDGVGTTPCSIPGFAGSSFSFPINQSLYGFCSMASASPGVGGTVSSPSSTYIPVGWSFT